jgi:tetratricopeptide (TPR) repeat protein
MRVLKEIRSLIGNYHVKSGVYHYYRNEYKQAVEYLRRALRESDQLADADEAKARHYLTLTLMDSATELADAGNYEAAVEELARAAEVSPGFPDIHFRAGGLFERLVRRREAIAAYRRAVKCNPRYLEAQVALGFCLIEAGDADRAAEAFQHALNLRRQQIEEPFEKGLELLKRGETREAGDCFHEAFRAFPELCHEMMRKAIARLHAEDYEEALRHFDRALQLNPKFPDLHNYRGITLCELERLDEAIDAFRLSAALSPGYLVPRLNLAFAHVRAGSIQEAEAELEAILEKDPTETAAQAKLDELRAGPPPEKRRPVSRGTVR